MAIVDGAHGNSRPQIAIKFTIDDDEVQTYELDLELKDKLDRVSDPALIRSGRLRSVEMEAKPPHYDDWS